MLTGWEWVRQRMARDELGAEHSSRIRGVVTKLCRSKWVLLYECVALVMRERMEALNDALARQISVLHEPVGALRCVPLCTGSSRS